MITLKTLPQATAQEVFDQCARYLLTQKKQSVEEVSGMCEYRGTDGTKCAAGCFIADNEYKKSMENKTWDDLFLDGLAPRDHLELMKTLQHVHDCNLPTDWWVCLDNLVAKDNLSTSVLDGFRGENS